MLLRTIDYDTMTLFSIMIGPGLPTRRSISVRNRLDQDIGATKITLILDESKESYTAEIIHSGISTRLHIIGVEDADFEGAESIPDSPPSDC